jgi:hypothetical protein
MGRVQRASILPWAREQRRRVWSAARTLFAVALGAGLLLSLGILLGERADRTRFGRQRPCRKPLPPDEAEVLAAAIPGSSGVVLAPQTGLHSLYVSVPAPGGALFDFFERNGESRCAPASLGSRPVAVQRLPETRYGPRPDYWVWFHEHYRSGGYYSVSRPGFSRDGQTAVVELGLACGSLCGHGEHVLLERRGGRWQVARRARTWIN